ncbi:type VI secretion protein [Labrys miyagiensis]|uniref:Type VI secretion protein n=1 Tax=Labrys miyagiensis TaxID=346912 RepID=A0ABQ6CIF3_9HYPH|nr:type VI secretion protein [Labrys miyagiensis]GLS18036.1 type VI secretion protein [Labrys miyagiensis]
MTLAKNVRTSLAYGAELGREAKVADHVPYTRHVDERTLRTKDGMLVQILKIEGFCHDTADYSTIDQMAEYRNTFLRALGDSRYAVYAHIIRRSVPTHMPGEFKNPFARLVNERYMDSLKDKRLYINDLYFTVLRKPSFRGKVGFADNIFRFFGRHSGATGDNEEAEALKELTQHVAAFETDMRRIGARVLRIIKEVSIERVGLVEFIDVKDLEEVEGEATASRETGGEKRLYRFRSEPVEFLAQLLNGGVPMVMRLPRMPLNEYIPTRRVTFGKRELELRGPADTGTRFGGFIGVRELRGETFAGVFDAMLKIPGEFIATQSFALSDRAEAIQHINLVERQLASSDERDTVLVSHMRTARDEVAKGEGVNGLYHLTVMGLGNTRAELEKAVQLLTKVVTNQGVVPVREDLNQEGCFWAQLPGNFEYIARRMTISSANFVGFASFHNYAVGKREGNHWGPAISLLMSKSQSPYYFNFHVRQLGNFSVIGPSGSGKTVALSFLSSQAMRVNPRLAFFDKDRGGEVFIRAMGGQYEVLQPGKPTGFNPLQVDDTPADRDFVTQLIKLLVRPRNEGRLTVEEERIVERAVDQLFQYPRRERRMDMVPELLSGSQKAHSDDIAARFEIWLTDRGWLFNNDVDRWDNENGIVGFDLTTILDDEDTRSAALFYIFHRLEGMVDGKRPFMLFIDEGWKVLGDERFSAKLNDKLKTIRKLVGLVGFGTQSAKDVISAKIAHTLLEQTSVNIFFPNVKADASSYQSSRDANGQENGGFKLTDTEFNWVRTALPESREFLIRSEHDSVIAKLDLSMMPDLVKVMSGTVESVEECARLRARYGEQPDQWLPYFCGWKKEATP